MSSSSEVKAFFEQTDVYLTFDYNLRLRSETVKEFIGDQQFKNVLDMPCGTGDISLPHFAQFEHLTCVDFSKNMVELTRSKVPAEEQQRATFINDDFYNIKFESEAYDLVISLGILAHIKDPAGFLAKIAALVQPGGTLIVQNTSSSHFYSALIRLYLGFRRLVGKDKYKLNKVPAATVESVLKDCNMELQGRFRYNQSFLGFSRLFSNDKKYQLTRNFFGSSKQNKHAGWGSDYLYHFKKKG